MKKLSILFSVALLAIILFMTGCEEDPPPAPVGPTLELSTDAGFVSDTATVAIDEVFKIKLTATKGDSSLSRITVKENGVAISNFDRITFDGFVAQSNPNPLGPGSEDGFTWVIEIKAQSSPDVTNTYSFEVLDNAGLGDEVSVDITSFDPGTPVSEKTMVLLLNQGGPVGTGGLDLHLGVGTGSADPTADIKDNGIDLAKPLAENWIQKISPANSAELRVPATAFKYADIATKEEIEAAFGLGTAITTSAKVANGDQFLVLSEGTYFAIIVTKISVTETDNGDYYEFSVKQ
ncbi:MAG: hypothetical protein SF052_26260 [Bacteroidia bacterium]|nr:hypothetical protein [Bacteroidia bacterium]